MTRRERLERKIILRREWATKAQARSQSRLSGAHRIMDVIPFGQPILVGHHSERHARADRRRIETGLRKGFEEATLAQHHDEKADGLARQLDRTVFSDDPDAIAQIQARMTANTAAADKYVALNKVFRKGGQAALAAVVSPEVAAQIALTMARCPWLKQPFTYEITNLRNRVRQDQERIKAIQNRVARTEKAAAAGGLLIEGEDFIRVTFDEKPARSVLDAMKAAEFRWEGGSWYGYRNKLPEGVKRDENQAARSAHS